MKPAQLNAFATDLNAIYQSLQNKQLNLDITRGKPSPEQVHLSTKLDGILNNNFLSAAGEDTRNYGNLRGISETCELGSSILKTPVSQVFTGGNSSLSLMYMAAMLQYSHGIKGSNAAPPWQSLHNPTFICPVPGYDRHFSVCEALGINMLTVPMLATGPDMDAVEKLIQENDQIVGMWCVPRFSNPTGVTFDETTVARIAKLGTIAHPAFRVFWDNAYAVHSLSDNAPELNSVWDCSVKYGTEDSIWQFASTSKATFAGAGVAWIASSTTNLQAFANLLSITTIGADKVNQLRHARFLPDKNALTAHMQLHAEILKPKFDIVFTRLENELTEYGSWTHTDGGYFISFDANQGLASQIVELAAQAGLKLTPAGATYPYGKDPEDRNIRLAPSFPSKEELDKAMQIFTICVKLATVKQLINQVS